MPETVSLRTGEHRFVCTNHSEVAQEPQTSWLSTLPVQLLFVVREERQKQFATGRDQLPGPVLLDQFRFAVLHVVQ